LSEPETLPPVTAPSDEPLVVAAHPLIEVVAAYHRVGFRGAMPGAWLRAGVLEGLVSVAGGLPAGFGLAIFDAWRPPALQAELYEAAYADPGLPAGFVAPPSDDPTRPPPHLTGGAVDLTLTWEGRPLALGTGFDDFTPTAHTGAFEHIPGPVRGLRRLLYWTMRAAGFVVLDCEWWHFEFGTRRWAAITGGSPRYGATSSPP
jgi:D-alanyl-D-alanine dipeptidase